MRPWLAGILLALLLAPAALAGGRVAMGPLEFQVPVAWAPLPDGTPQARDFALPGSGSGHAFAPTLSLFTVTATADGGQPYGVIHLLGVFAEPAGRLRSRVWREELLGSRAVMVEATGTYLARGTNGPGGTEQRHPDVAILAAIVETREGPVVARLLAPAATAREMAPEFWAMVRAVGEVPKS